MGSLKKLYGWYPDGGAWVPIKVNTNGKVVLSSIPPNPYKFSAYRAAALNTPNSNNAIVAYDTERFDTNNNFDITTNKGRYTAPVDGFYFFTANISHNANIRTVLDLYLNGAPIIRGQDFVGSGGNISLMVSGLIQLTAAQYVEVNIWTPSATAFFVTQAYGNNFEGFLVSQT